MMNPAARPGREALGRSRGGLSTKIQIPSHDLPDTLEPGTDQTGRALVALAVVVAAGQPVQVSLRIGEAAAVGWIRQWLRPRRARGPAAVRQRAGRVGKPRAWPPPSGAR